MVHIIRHYNCISAEQRYSKTLSLWRFGVYFCITLGLLFLHHPFPFHLVKHSGGVCGCKDGCVRACVWFLGMRRMGVREGGCERGCVGRIEIEIVGWVCGNSINEEGVILCLLSRPSLLLH